MPELKCTVQTCVHNKQFLCDLDKIEVGGSNAKTPRETCCDSFQERKNDSSSNSYSNSYSDVNGKASDCSCIDCKAVECMYNCNLEKVKQEEQVSGLEPVYLLFLVDLSTC